MQHMFSPFLRLHMTFFVFQKMPIKKSVPPLTGICLSYWESMLEKEWCENYFKSHSTADPDTDAGPFEYIRTFSVHIMFVRPTTVFQLLII